MNEEENEKEIFRADAKQMVDSMFDNNLFRKDLTRDEMNALENWINVAMSGKYCIMRDFKEIIKGIDERH